MALTPRLRLGPYGDGKVGLKAAFPGFDVTDTTRDNDGDARSFNSEWTSLLHVALFGYSSASVSNLPTGSVVHGLGYIPYYVVRLYGASTRTFYDDYWMGSAAQSVAVQSDANTNIIEFSIFRDGAPSSLVSYVIWKRAIGT